jgi:hypothetical protein
VIYNVCNVRQDVVSAGALQGIPLAIISLLRDTQPADEVASMDSTVGDDALWARASCSEISAYVSHTYGHLRWTLLTGCDGMDLEALVHALHDCAFQVAIQVDGSSDMHLDCDADLVIVRAGINALPHVVKRAHEIHVDVLCEGDIQRTHSLMMQAGMGRAPSVLPVQSTHKPVFLFPSQGAAAITQAACVANHWRMAQEWTIRW